MNATNRVHVLTPEEKQAKEQVDLVVMRAIRLYKLAIDLSQETREALRAEDASEAERLGRLVDEIESRARQVELEAVERHLEFLKGISRAEGWPLPPEVEQDEKRCQDRQ